MTKLQAYTEKYLPFAIEMEKKYKVPALVAMAQSALESGFGTAKPGNMMFGIKANKSWTGKKQLLRTREVLSTPDSKKFPEVISVTKRADGKYLYVVRDYFRAYDSPYESFVDYAKFLIKNPRYQAAFNYTDPVLFAKEIARAGYATDPNYFDKLKSLIGQIEEKKK